MPGQIVRHGILCAMPHLHAPLEFLPRPAGQDVAAVRAIYLQAFAAAERKPWELLLARWEAGHYLVAGLRCYPGGEIVSNSAPGKEPHGPLGSLAFLLPLRNPNLLFLEYLAVDAALRGRGMGSHLMRELLAGLGTLGFEGLVWELESPSASCAMEPMTGAIPAAPGELAPWEQETLSQAGRRLRFYQRLGGSLISESSGYAMPDMARPGELLPLRLMEYPVGTVSGSQQYEVLVEAIYRAAYPESVHLLPRILDRS